MTSVRLEKGEPMKGLLNNDQAVNVLNNLKGSLDNRIHEIYNLAYQKGYKDGYNAKQDEIIQTLTEQILAERRADEHTD